MTPQQKALRNRMIKGEDEAISSYSKGIKKSKGKEKEVFKHILPEEKNHKKELISLNK